MKTLVFKGSNSSAWAFDDDHVVDMQENRVLVTAPWGAVLDIPWMNKNNTLIYENVTLPDGWGFRSHFYDGSTWSPDPTRGGGNNA